MVSNSLEKFSGNELVIVRAWHISVFSFLLSFIVLYIFFYTFQPSTLLGSGSWLFYAGPTSGGGVVKTNTNSENKIENKWLSEKGREIIFVWAICLGALIGFIVHCLIVYF